VLYKQLFAICAADWFAIAQVELVLTIAATVEGNLVLAIESCWKQFQATWSFAA
jgi:hypothetical protein